MHNIHIKQIDDIASLTEALAEKGAKKILAGGTDLNLQLHKNPAAQLTLIDIGCCWPLRGIWQKGQALHIGSATTFSQLIDNQQIKQFFPALWQSISQIGSKQIRNQATLGGNIANCAPAADSLAPLLIYGAKLLLLSGISAAYREVALAELLAQKPRAKNSPLLGQEQAIVEIILPLPQIAPGTNQRSAFAKLGNRSQVTISKINLAMLIVSDSVSGAIVDGAIALGAVGATPFLCDVAGLFDSGSVLEKGAFDNIYLFVREQIELSIKGRASLSYKATAVKGVVDDVCRSILAMG